MIVCEPSALQVADFVIPFANPFITLVYIGNKNGRVIKTEHNYFKIDEIYHISGKSILNPNLKIKSYTKTFCQIPNKTKFIYGDKLYVKVLIDLGDGQCYKGYDIDNDSIKFICPSEDVFVIEEIK
jgi:hypothetical protein